MHTFFYDETEHSRVINYKTVTADNFYDNFIASIVGWTDESDAEIRNSYILFENKYAERKTKGELKSTTMKSKDFRNGFASFSNNTIGFYSDLLSQFENVTIYFSVFSKIEYVINQLFADYKNSALVDFDLAKYTVIKAINIYKPVNVIESIYTSPRTFVDELKMFLSQQIERDRQNTSLKESEIQAFENVLILLDEVKPIENLNWYYYPAFDGFCRLLQEININEYTLVLDREGDNQNTLKAACSIGLSNVSEEVSDNEIGIRMADMLSGFISKLMQALRNALIDKTCNEQIKKKVLPKEWFRLNSKQLDLYKRLYRILCEKNKHWYSIYSGIYSDDLVMFISLLQYMNTFESVECIQKNYDMHPEYLNSAFCENLSNRFSIVHNKLPVEFVNNDSEYFCNQRGATVHKNSLLNLALPLKEGKNIYHVLSVGIDNKGTVLITIKEKEGNKCYRLPDAYTDWAVLLIDMANRGMNLLPENVLFTVQGEDYFVDIL